MLEYISPEGNNLNDNKHHKYIRELTDKQPNIANEREFTREQTGSVIEGMNYKKTPGENGKTSENIKLT